MKPIAQSGKRQYDLAFGIGAACSCTQTLRGAGAQYLSFPFDWIGPRLDSPAEDEDAVRRVGHVCSNFAHWLEREDFHTQGDNDGDHLTNGMLDCFNERFQMRFIHDFPRTMSLDESFAAINGKYRRRIERLTELIRQSQRILVFRVERPDRTFETPVESLRTARRMLSERYPGKQFDLLAFRYRRGIPFEARLIEDAEDGITIVSFDYKSADPKAQPFETDMRHMTAALRDLVSVRDYRTKDEIRQHKASVRRKKLEKSGCKTWFGYRLRQFGNSILKRLPLRRPSGGAT